MPDLHSRPITLEDLDAARAFNARVYTPDSLVFNPEFFAWQNLRCGGRDRTADPGAWGAFDGDRMVGACLISRYDVFLDGRTVPGGWFHYWFSDVEGKSVGLPLLAHAARGLEVIAGARVTVAAVAAMQAYFRNFLWFEIPRLMAVFDPEAAASLSMKGDREATARYLAGLRRPEPEGSVTCRDLNRFDAAYDSLWREVRGGFLVVTERDARFMNWRYIDHPHLTYRCVWCDTGSGPAVFVWRDEPVSGTDIFVARVCEAIGSPAALTRAVPAVLEHMNRPEAALVDFFCSNAEVNGALIAGGLVPVTTRPDFDLASRLRPPEAYASKTLDFYLSMPRGGPGPWDHHRAYLTRGDGNQDIPVSAAT